MDDVYQAYLKSKAWSRRRDLVLQRCGRICERCDMLPVVDVHHLTYDRIFREPIEDLLGVCRGCHDVLHDLGTLDPLKVSQWIKYRVKLRKWLKLHGKNNKRFNIRGEFKRQFVETDLMIWQYYDCPMPSEEDQETVSKWMNERPEYLGSLRTVGEIITGRVK